MASINQDVTILDYAPNTSAAANAVTNCPLVRLTAKLAVAIQVFPSASAAGTIAVQMTNYDDTRNATGAPSAATTWVTMQSITVTGGTPSMTMVTNPFAKYIRLVFTAGSGSSGTVQMSLNLRAAYAT